jgi:hypothetical protein
MKYMEQYTYLYIYLQLTQEALVTQLQVQLALVSGACGGKAESQHLHDNLSIAGRPASGRLGTGPVQTGMQSGVPDGTCSSICIP